MENQRNRGTGHHLHMIKLELSKTNEKLDILVELLTRMVSDNIKIHNRK